MVRVHLSAEKVFSRKDLCSFGFTGFYIRQMETAPKEETGHKVSFLMSLLDLADT